MIIGSLLSADGLAVLMAVLLGCFIKGALGFGLPLIATPIMLFVLPLPEIVTILALPITISNIQQIWLNRKHWQILKKFWHLVATSTLIMLVGAPLMVAIDSRLLGILIGLMIALHAILSSFPPRQFQRPVACHHNHEPPDHSSRYCLGHSWQSDNDIFFSKPSIIHDDADQKR